MEGYGNENPGAFQPTRPLRGATEIAHKLTDTIKFQPTRPLRGATRPASSGSACRSNFNPRAPCGARPVWIRIEIAIHDFNPRAPCGARRTPRATSLTRTTNFNPRAPCGARPRARFPLSIFLLISTHAPLAGRDSKSVQITMHIFAITDKFQMLLHRMPPVRAFCSFLMQENHADFGCEPPK